MEGELVCIFSYSLQELLLEDIFWSNEPCYISHIALGICLFANDETIYSIFSPHLFTHFIFGLTFPAASVLIKYKT